MTRLKEQCPSELSWPIAQRGTTGLIGNREIVSRSLLPFNLHVIISKHRG